MVLKLGGWARCQQPLNVKGILLGNVNAERLGPGLILRYDLSNEKWGMRFGTWNVRIRHRAGSLTAAEAAAKELGIN